MNNNEEKLYKSLHEKQLTRNELFDLSYAMQELAKAFSGHNAWDTLREVRNAQRHLDEFRGNIIPTPELTEDEANLAAGLHTYMRKNMDCPLGTLLYRLISESRGTNIWYAFIKSLQKAIDSPKMNKLTPEKIYNDCIHSAEECYGNASDTSDDLFMLSALRMWGEDIEIFENALDFVDGDE